MSEAKAQTGLTIQRIEKPVLELTVCGFEPGLLLDRHVRESELGPLSKNPTDEEFERHAAEKVYELDPPRDNSTLGIKAICFRLAMAEAGRGLKLKMTEVRQAIRVESGPDGLLPICPDDWVAEIVSVQSGGRQGGRIWIARPRFPAGWQVAVPIRYNPRLFTEEDIAALLDEAGDSVGVGAWRPSNDGDHGRFGLA